jgi:hypothetical protein
MRTRVKTPLIILSAHAFLAGCKVEFADATAYLPKRKEPTGGEQKKPPQPRRPGGQDNH